MKNVKKYGAEYHLNGVLPKSLTSRKIKHYYYGNSYYFLFSNLCFIDCFIMEDFYKSKQTWLGMLNSNLQLHCCVLYKSEHVEKPE
jgi:hypothetical protein